MAGASRLMYDSTSAVDIPTGSQLVGGYVDGSEAWSAADWDRFPGRQLVRICIFNDRYSADMIDIEPGNDDARGAVPWIREKWLRGETPTVYCFSDAGPKGYTISDVRAECDAAGLKHPLFIIAEWDNNPSTFDPTGDPEIIGKQYANSAQTGGHYDASVVADYWPGVDTVGGNMTGTEIIAALKADPELAHELYALVAPDVQDKVVAPQANTNTWLKEYTDAVKAGDAAAIAVAETKIGVALERAAKALGDSAVLIESDAAK
jgi:hypothetical protein